MNNKQLILDTSKTMVLLMKSTGRYVHRKIYSKSDKAAYLCGMKLCIAIFKQELQNMDMIRARIIGVKEEAQHLYKDKFFSKNTEKRYFKLAVDHALDVVKSLESKFITGGDSFYVNGEPVEWSIYEDEDLF